MEPTEMVALPDDALAHVFRRLPPRSLAIARGACNAWRATVDGRALLLLHRQHLPHYVHGVFVNYIDHCRPHLFSRPFRPSSAAAAAEEVVDGMLSFLPIDNHRVRDWWSVLDHCRGLVLCDIKSGGQLCVCNPATRRWTLVPPRWPVGAIWREYTSVYLAFDPAMSAHYEVVLIPTEPERPWREPPSPPKRRNERPAFEVRLHGVDDAPFCLDDWLQSSSHLGDLADDDDKDEEEKVFIRQQGQRQVQSSMEEDMAAEWPPTPWTLEVFSSSAGRWEQRAFVRHGDPVATVQDMRLDQRRLTCRGPRQRYAAYWKGALYVHCRGSFITRFSMLNYDYQVIKTPEYIKKGISAKPYLGISEKGVYFGIVQDRQLQIWILNESCGRLEWVLKCEDDFTHCVQHVRKYGAQMNAPWIVHDAHDADNAPKAILEERFEWDSDHDDIFTIEDGLNEEHYGSFDILGFHPYKEVVFLADYFTVVAYHLNTSKVQFLGNSRPKSYYRSFTNDIYESFVYTPCMIGELNEDSTMNEN